MASPATVKPTSNLAPQSQMFTGWKIWFSQRVPQRSRFIDDVKSHGGTVVPLDKQADIRIVDHARKEQPPGTHSYTFVEHSVRNGALENPDDHAVGSVAATARSIGSITQPAKATRAKYTATDDRILWNWVQAHPQKGGGTDGNEIYKQLEAKHPQHPWQSWRDRYIKKLKDRPRPYAQLENASPTPSIGRASSNGPREVSSEENEMITQQVPFTEEDAQALLRVADDFLNIRPSKSKEAWQNWSDEYNEAKHSPEQWRKFWELSVKPRHLARQEDPKGDSDQEQLFLSQRHAVALSGDESNERDTTNRVSPSQSKHGHVKRDGSSSHDIASGSDGHQEVSNSRKRKRQATENLIRSAASRTSPSGPRVYSKTKDDQSIQKSVEAEPVYASDQSPSPEIEGATIKIEGDNDQSVEALSVPVSASQEPYVEPASRGDRASTQALFREKSPSIDFDVAPPHRVRDELSPAKVGRAHLATGPTPGSPEIDFDVASPHLPDRAVFPELDDQFLDLEDEADRESLLDAKLEGADEPMGALHLRSTIPDTQAILQTETQMPDLDIPEPDGGFDSLLGPQDRPDLSPDKGESVASSGEIDQQVDQWIQLFVEKGFAANTVTAALTSTSLDLELAEKVLDFMNKGKGKKNGASATELPKDWAGVWTAADDEALQSTDARKLAMVERKHGSKAMQARWEFVEFYQSC